MIEELVGSVVLVCTHVLDKTAEAEYQKEDDSYVCSNCRDLHDKEDDLELTKPFLRMVHRSCLGV